jgi:hypothetical protein
VLLSLGVLDCVLYFRRGNTRFFASPSAEQLRAVESGAADCSGPLLFCRAGGAQGVLDWKAALHASSSGVVTCPSFLR